MLQVGFWIFVGLIILWAFIETRLDKLSRDEMWRCNSRRDKPRRQTKGLDHPNRRKTD